MNPPRMRGKEAVAAVHGVAAHRPRVTPARNRRGRRDLRDRRPRTHPGVGRAELLGDAILKLVITKGVDVINVTHLGRSPTVAQQVALWWLAPMCTAEGCTRTRRLENDHRIGWAETQRTRLDELDPLCDHEHDLKTYFGWALVPGKGRRAFVPPDDPRHPKYRAPPDP